MTFPEVHAIFDGRLRNTLTKDYNLRELKKKICNVMLLKEEILQIRNLLKENMNIIEIANRFNISMTSVYSIKYGKTYKNVV